MGNICFSKSVVVFLLPVPMAGIHPSLSLLYLLFIKPKNIAIYVLNFLTYNYNISEMNVIFCIMEICADIQKRGVHE